MLCQYFLSISQECSSPNSLQEWREGKKLQIDKLEGNVLLTWPVIDINNS